MQSNLFIKICLHLNFHAKNKNFHLFSITLTFHVKRDKRKIFNIISKNRKITKKYNFFRKFGAKIQNCLIWRILKVFPRWKSICNFHKIRKAHITKDSLKIIWKTRQRFRDCIIFFIVITLFLSSLFRLFLESVSRQLLRDIFE